MQVFTLVLLLFFQDMRNSDIEESVRDKLSLRELNRYLLEHRAT